MLDNAMEASTSGIALSAAREKDALRIRVRDSGPGFSADRLERFGRPYESTKGRLGGGLGLFLVVNVMRKLGGTVEAENAPIRGAIVTIRLPLASIALPERSLP